jgi:hypothetical protein
MPVRTIDELLADMPLNTPWGISSGDIRNLVETLGERTTQRVVAKTAAYPAVLADDRTFFTMNSASGHSFTVPSDAYVGWECAVMQIGAGQTQFFAGGTGAIRNDESHTRTAKLYAVVYLKVYQNSGTAPQVALMGSTAA